MSGVADMPRAALSIEVGGKTIKMSYGLLMDLQRLLPSPEDTLQLVLEDPYTQDYVMRRCFTEKKGAVNNPDELISAEDIDVSPEEMSQLLNWVVQHVLHFFAMRAESIKDRGTEFQVALPRPSTLGSPGSPSTTPSAGPLES